jgi:type IX secretion system PorP/SprF family membrane protein
LSRVTLFLLVTLLYGYSFGQNYPLYNSYITNPYLINPAEAASSHLNIFANYRNQWNGLNGAPKIATVGFSTLINDTRVGIGFKASSFKRGFLNTTDASFTYSYGVPIDKQNKIFFGLSGGILSNSIDWGMISDNTDPALVSLKGSIMPSLAFGAMLKNSSGFNIGLVLPQMIKAKSLDSNFGIAAQDNVMLVAYYSNWIPQAKVNSHNKSRKTHKKGKNKGSPLEVFSVFRYSNVGMQVEGTAKLNFQSAFWLSATYRKASGLIPGLGINLSNFSLGYFYESGIAGDIPLKSHELSLNIKLGAEKKFKGEGKPVDKTPSVPKPRFGNPDNNEPKMSKANTKSKNKPVVAKVDKPKANTNTTKTVPDTKKEPVVTTEVKKDPVIETPKDPVITTPAEVKKDPVVTNPNPEVKKDPVVITPTEVKREPVVTPEVKKEPVTTPEVKKDPVVPDPNPRLKNEDPVVTTPTVEEEKIQHDDEQDKLKRLTEHADNPTEEHNEEGHPHAERHEFVKRGDHVKELDLGDFVIVGVFRGEANAKHMSDELKKLGFSEVDYGYLTNKAVWYIHIAGSNDIEEARTKRDKYRKMKMFKDAWLLTVHQ